ncbi:MAG TPA: APC family permease [Nocardioidaceae bacterium]
MSDAPRLERRLSTGDAVVLGLGSMVGAGVFAAFAPAAAAAGSWLLVGLVLAAGVAYCNATSSAQLAAQYPSSGGTYLYGRERLGEWWGFLAGWAFVVGKTASLAAMALTFAAYAVRDDWQRPVAVVAVLSIAGVNYRGITRTAQLTRVIVSVVLAALAVGVTVSLLGSDPSLARLTTGSDEVTLRGVLQSAAVLFFAFAGYARIATLAEEVRDPERTIPRAVTVALSLAVLLYALVGATVLMVLGPENVAATAVPLVEAVETTSWTWASPIIRLGAAAASLGAMLALTAGVGRTALAMGRNGDLPRTFAAVHPRFHVPHHAEVAVAAVVCVLVLTVDLRGAIGLSSFAVLLYYFVANVAATTQDSGHRRYPRFLQVAGAAGCLTLAVTVPATSLLSGLVVLAVGLGYRFWRVRHAGK